MPKQLTPEQEATAKVLITRRRAGDKLTFAERQILFIFEKKKHGRRQKK